MKIRKLISITLLASTLLVGYGVRASATSMAVSPSKVYDQQAEKGETKVFSFKIANTSEVDERLDVNFDATMVNEYGEEIDSKGILSLDKSKDNLEKGTSSVVNLTVKTPRDIGSGNYLIYLSFTQEPVVSESMVSPRSVIRIPIYVYLGDKSTYENLKVDFNINSTSIDAGEQTTVYKEIFRSCFRLLNPAKIVDTYKNVINRPMYDFLIDGKQVIDINNNIYTNLEDVCSTSKNLTENKYVHYERGWLDEKIINSVNDGSTVSVMLKNGEVVVIRGTEESLSFIQNQLSSIATMTTGADLRYIFKNLKVPKNVTYEKAKPLMSSEISSNSEIPITLKGELANIKNFSDKVFEDKKVTSPTIKSGETIDFKSPISDKDIDDGNYIVKGTIGIRSINQPIECSFEVKKSRNSVLIGMSAFLVMYLAIIIASIVRIIKFIKSKIKIRWGSLNVKK